MSLFKKIKSLMGNEETATSPGKTEAVDKFSPEALDSPPYTFVNALHAARQGNVKKVQEYLSFNRNYVYCKNWEDCTLLHEASRFSRKDCVQLLLDNGAEVNSLYKGKTPLHLAIEGDPKESANKDAEQVLEYRKRRRETVKLLLMRHADLNAPNEAGELPLHVAAKLGYSELVDVLLAHGAVVNSKVESNNPNATNVGRTPLLLATRYNKDKKTIKLLLNKGADPNVKDANGYAALHHIVSHHGVSQNITENDLKELAEMLVTNHADINAYTEDKEQQTPLHLAINHQHRNIVDLLISQGANLHAKDGTGLMPMGLSARNGDAEMVEYLLSKGTDIYKSRALFHAASCRHSDAALRLLLDKGADINMPDVNGYTPIFSAISAYSLTNVKLLLERGIDVRQHSPKGLTVLEHAFACWGEVECVSGDEIAAERRRDADNARDIIQLLGGFDKQEKKMIF